MIRSAAKLAAAGITSMAVVVAVDGARPVAADDVPYAIVTDQITSSTDDVLIYPDSPEQITVDSYQGFPIDVDIALRIEHGSASQLSIQLATAARRPHDVVRDMTGADLGAGDECSDPTVFDDDAPHSYYDVDAPRADRVRPEPRMDEFLHHSALEGFNVVFREEHPEILGRIDCYVVTVTSVVPHGDGTYRVTDPTDTIDFTDDALTLREAFILADNDRQASTVILQDDTTYQLDQCEGLSPLKARSSDPLEVIGNGATIKAGCSLTSVVDVGEASLAMSDVEIGPADAYGVLGGDIELTRVRVVDTKSGVFARGHLTVRDSELVNNGDRSQFFLTAIYGKAITLIDSVVRLNHGASFGAVEASDTISVVDSIIEQNSSHTKGVLEATSISIDGSVVGNNTSPLPTVNATTTVDVADSTIRADTTVLVGAQTLLARRSALFGSSQSAGACGVLRVDADPVDINVVGSATCAGPADIVVDDPMLEPFGLPRPLPGSPLIDAIPAPRCVGEIDVLDTPRPQGDGCDIGAIEFRVPRTPINPDDPANPAEPPGLPIDTATPGFEAIEPARLLDTRPGGVTIDGQHSGAGPIPAGTTIEVATAGRGGVDPDATAAF
ncbi:MAG: choice-of-anchor Q domain-containing protein, partial [Actinomycetota bacterium]